MKLKKILFLLWICYFNEILVNQVTVLPYLDEKAQLNFVKQFLPNNPKILEAGAFDGKESITMAKLWPKSTLYTFEPIPELFNLVKKNTAIFKNINCYNLALSDKIGNADFYVSEFSFQPGVASASSSLLPPKEHLNYCSHVQFKKKINVKTTTIDDWSKQNNISQIDMLWLDMQGYELNALKHATSILKKVKIIVTEVEFVEAYKGQYLYQDIKKWLEEQGFKLIAVDFELPIKDLKLCWFGTAIFLKK